MFTLLGTKRVRLNTAFASVRNCPHGDCWPAPSLRLCRSWENFPFSVGVRRVRELVECCFTSTETVGLLGTGAQDGHLDFHTAP